mmetsp:Transcript_6139/g.10393  ORF Transcript_6139/g.10393 Transcript_6139/m.10393 type:complete len:201 (-) Transcript_6139:20-622(-)
MTTISSPSPSRARAAAAADLAASRVTVYFGAVGPVAALIESTGPCPPLAARVPAAAALALLVPVAMALPVKNACPVGAMNLPRPPRPPLPRPPLLPRPPPRPLGLRLRELVVAVGLSAAAVVAVVEPGCLTSLFEDDGAAAGLVEADDGSVATAAFFAGRLSGLNLPAWTGFFFGGMLMIPSYERLLRINGRDMHAYIIG